VLAPGDVVSAWLNVPHDEGERWLWVPLAVAECHPSCVTATTVFAKQTINFSAKQDGDTGKIEPGI